MAKNQDKTKNDIYNYFKSNGYEPVLKSTNGKEVSVPDEAEVIEFQFKVDDVNYGTAAVSLDNEGMLKVFYSDKIKSSPSSSEHGETTWNDLIPALRRMTFGKTKSFELDDMDNLGYDMAKREHSKKLEEGYYPMGKKASYSDNIPECKIVIKHNRNIEEGEQRYRNIHQIFIENQMGERFLAPTNKPGLARVYARHIAEGGKVNDDKWNHITGLCEEYSKMAGFIRATRNGQFNEDTQRLVTAGVEHYISLRESLHKLAGKRGYNNYFESWAPPLMEGEDSEDLGEMFVHSSLDPRIESVIPILSRLNKTISENQDIKQVVELEEWADNVAGVSESFGSGHEHGLASPTAPSLKRQRDRDSGDDEPQGMFTVMINSKPWKEDSSNKAFAMAQRVANKHPDKKVAVKWPTGQLNTVKAQGVAEDIGPQQHAVGQLGATAKVSAGGTILGNPERSQKGLRGKLVGTNESVDPLAHIVKLSK